MDADASPVVRTVGEHRHLDFDLTERQARLLQAAAGSRLTVSPASSGYRVTASSYVGAIQVPGLVVHVTPKVPVRNVLRLLTWSTHRLELGENLDHALEDITSAVAALYASTLERALVLGVDRTYREDADRLVTLRGRIDLVAQSRAAGLATPVACRYDEWSVDTRPNRVVRAAAQVLLRLVDVALAPAFALRRLLVLLDGVGPLRPDDATTLPELTRN